jgi:hypothetical protein
LAVLRAARDSAAEAVALAEAKAASLRSTRNVTGRSCKITPYLHAGRDGIIDLCSDSEEEEEDVKDADGIAAAAAAAAGDRFIDLTDELDLLGNAPAGQTPAANCLVCGRSGGVAQMVRCRHCSRGTHAECLPGGGAGGATHACARCKGKGPSVAPAPARPPQLDAALHGLEDAKAQLATAEAMLATAERQASTPTGSDTKPARRSKVGCRHPQTNHARNASCCALFSLAICCSTPPAGRAGQGGRRLGAMLRRGQPRR